MNTEKCGFSGMEHAILMPSSLKQIFKRKVHNVFSLIRITCFLRRKRDYVLP